MQANATSHVMGLQILETIWPSRTIHPLESKGTAISFIQFKLNTAEDEKSKCLIYKSAKESSI